MKTETTRAGEFLKSEANGTYSREEVTVTGGPYVAGQVLGKITASGKYTAYTPGAVDGTEAVAAILWSGVDASASDVEKTVIVRAAEVWESLLTGDDADAITDLAAIGIITR